MARLSETELRKRLKYVADSPAHGRGGFYPNEVSTAKTALAWMDEARELLVRWNEERQNMPDAYDFSLVGRDTEAFLKENGE